MSVCLWSPFPVGFIESNLMITFGEVRLMTAHRLRPVWRHTTRKVISISNELISHDIFVFVITQMMKAQNRMSTDEGGINENPLRIWKHSLCVTQSSWWASRPLRSATIVDFFSLSLLCFTVSFHVLFFSCCFLVWNSISANVITSHQMWAPLKPAFGSNCADQRKMNVTESL